MCHEAAALGNTVVLLLGFRAAGLKSRFVAVDDGAKILGKKLATHANMAKLFRKTNELLHSQDPSFPLLDVAEIDFGIRAGFEKRTSGELASRGLEAIRRGMQKANLLLDEMFSANAIAALLADGENGQLREKTVLWWNSYNSRDYSAQIASADYRQLPKYSHHYFENGVQ